MRGFGASGRAGEIDGTVSDRPGAPGVAADLAIIGGMCIVASEGAATGRQERSALPASTGLPVSSECTLADRE